MHFCAVGTHRLYMPRPVPSPRIRSDSSVAMRCNMLSSWRRVTMQTAYSILSFSRRNLLPFVAFALPLVFSGAYLRALDTAS